MVLYPLVGGVKGISILKAVSFSSLAIGLSEASGSHDAFDDGDFIGHSDSHGLEEHDHSGHHHGDHEDHGHGDHEEHDDHDDHGEHEDHEDLDHEHEHDEAHEEGEQHYEEEMEAHTEEADVEVSVPGLAGRERLHKMKQEEEKPAEGMAASMSKVVKSVAAASLMVSAASRLVEERSRDLGLSPWGALAAACVGVQPRCGAKPRPLRKVELAGKSKKEHISAGMRHADFVL